MSEEVGTAFVSIFPSLDGFSRRLRQQLQRELLLIDGPVHDAGNRAGGTFGNAFTSRLAIAMGAARSVITTALLGGVAAAALGLGALTGFGLKSAAEFEQTQIGFAALLGSAEAAQAQLAELQQFAATTPFEFAGIANAGRRILAFGDAAGIARSQLIPTLTTVGDLVSVLGGGQAEMDSVVRSLGQIASKGKVSQEELLQLAEALPGFNVNAAIASQLGLSVADSMERITKGGLDARTGIDAILDGMRQFPGAAGAMQAQSQTLLGVFSTFKDTMQIALTEAFQPVVPLVKDSLAELTPILGGALKVLAPALGTLTAALLPLLGQLAQAITPVLVPILEGMAAAVTTLVDSGVLPQLGEAFGKILTELVPLAPVLAEAGVAFLQALLPAILAIAPELPLLVTSFAKMMETLAPLIPFLAQLTAVLVAFAFWPVVLAAFADEAVALGRRVIGAIAPLVTWLGNAVTSVLDFFRTLPGKALAFLQGLPSMLVDLAQRAFNALTFAVGFGIGAIIKFFIDLPGNIATLVTSLWDRVKALFTSGVDNAKTTVRNGIDSLISTARGLPGRFMEAIRALPGQLAGLAVDLANRAVQLGHDIIAGVVRGIRNSIGTVRDTLLGGFNSAIAGVKRGLGIASPSKVFADIGEDTIAGYVKGIEDTAKRARFALTAALVAPAREQTPAPPPAEATTLVDNYIEIGGEVVRVVRGEIDDSNRALRRRVLTGTGRR